MIEEYIEVPFPEDEFFRGLAIYIRKSGLMEMRLDRN